MKTSWLSDEYDHKALKKYLVIAVVMTIAMKVTAGFAALLIPIFVISSLVSRKPVESLFWVIFMTATSIGSHAIFSTNFISVMVIRVTLVSLAFCLASKIFGGRSAKVSSAFWGIMPYILWECAISAQGFEPVVSYLKLFLFLCIFVSLYAVADQVNASSRVNAKILRSVILSIIVLFIFGSIGSIPFPSISMMAKTPEIMEKMLHGEMTSLFCGLTSHSQALGSFTGVIATFLFADMVFSLRKWDALYVALILGCMVCCYKASSRTGMGTMIAGLGFVTFLFMMAKGVGSSWRSRVLSIMSVIVILSAFCGIAVPQVRERVTKFALKWGGEEKGEQVTVENMFATRQGKIDIALYNFKQKPITGNGFQVSEEMKYERRSGIAAYLAAPVEKGVWIFAIMEEGGAIGLILFVGWLLILFPALYARQGYVMASTFFGFMMANTGEFSLFSMTFLGGFYWVMSFAAGCIDVQRLKGQQVQVFDVPIEVIIEEEGIDEWTRRLG